MSAVFAVVIVGVLFGGCRCWESALEINRRFLATHRDEAVNQSALSAFQSKACRQFYAEPSAVPTALGDSFALEDLHRGGRYAAFTQGIMQQEVIVSLKWRFAYVLVRKSANTAIRAGLDSLFGVSYNWCAARCAGAEACYGSWSGKGNRCTSAALRQAELSTFFFFSFVKHPMERWFSQYAQAHVMWGQTHTTPSKDKALATLGVMGRESVIAEHHLQTQTHSLTTRTGRGSLVPMHFIGRTETMERDWAHVVREIWRRNNVTDYATRPVAPLPRKNHHEQQRDRFVAQMAPLRADAHVRQLIREVYTQDFVCFGYKMNSTDVA